MRLSGYYKDGFNNADAENFQRPSEKVDKCIEIVFSSGEKGIDVKIECSENSRKRRREEEEEKEDENEEKRSKSERNGKNDEIGEKSDDVEDKDKENEDEVRVSKSVVKILSDYRLSLGELGNDRNNEKELDQVESNDSNSHLDSGKSSENVSNSSTVCSCLGENCDDCKLGEEIFGVVNETTPILDDDGLPIVTADDLRNYKKSDKREFMKMVSQADIDRVNDKLFEKEEKIINVKVSRMTQSLRFWLAVKFSSYSNWKYNGKKRIKFGNKEVCALFGINYSSFKNFMSKNKNVNCRNFKYLSPVECNYKKQRFYFRDYASNYEILVREKLFDREKRKKKTK